MLRTSVNTTLGKSLQMCVLKEQRPSGGVGAGQFGISELSSMLRRLTKKEQDNRNSFFDWRKRSIGYLEVLVKEIFKERYKIRAGYLKGYEKKTEWKERK